MRFSSVSAGQQTLPYKPIASDALRFVGFLMACLLFSSGAPAADDNVLFEQKLEPYPFPIIVSVVVAGTGYPFILDTGAGFDVLDPSLERALGPATGSESVKTSGGNTDVKLFKAPPITMGHWTLPAGEATLFALDGARSMLGIDLRGIVGGRAMKDCALALDFDHGELRIFKGNVKPPAPMQTSELAIQTGGTVAIKAEMEGRELEFLVDTGSNGYIGLAHDIYAQMVSDGTIKEEEGGGSRTETGAGAVTQPRAHFTKGHLLGVDLAGMPVSDANTLCNVGIGFLLNFDSMIDFQEAKFHYLIRNASPPLDHHAMLGLMLMYSHGRNHVFKVSSVSGAAKEAGIKVWDHIVRLGPLKGSEINEIGIYELCLNQAGETLEVEIERPGEEQPLLRHLTIPQKKYEYPPRK